MLLSLSLLLLLTCAPPNLLDEPSRVIHGNISAPDSWPQVAALIFRYYRPAVNFCGGVVWDDMHILTVAHCMKPFRTSDVQVYLGHTDISTLDNDYIFDIEQAFIHPNYNNNTKLDDIAVLRLSRQLDFEGKHHKVRCACEPEPLENLDLKRCIILGWGDDENDRVSRQLREGLVQAENCTPECSLGPRWIKAGDMVNKVDTCSGDSGGPMLCALKVDAAVWSLVGLTSRGNNMCSMGIMTRPGIYTRVWYYLDFIEFITSFLDPPPPYPTLKPRPINSSCQLHYQQVFIVTLLLCLLQRAIE